MIFSDLGNWERGSVHPVLERGLDYLRSNDFTGMEPGKYAIIGDDMFALVQDSETGPRSERKVEHHRKYIDIQYLVKGREIIGYGRSSGRDVRTVDELDEKDYALVGEISDEIDLVMVPGRFAVFFPDDLHKPCVSPNGAVGTVRKVIIKVNRALLNV